MIAAIARRRLDGVRKWISTIWSANWRPQPNRVGKCVGDLEHHLDEGAVMVAFAMHLLRTTSTQEVRIHLDGEHGKRFDFAKRRGYRWSDVADGRPKSWYVDVCESVLQDEMRPPGVAIYK